jgi:hypothetical protein
MPKICSFCRKLDTCDLRKGMKQRKEKPAFVDAKTNKYIKTMIEKILAEPNENLGRAEVGRLRELDELQRPFTPAEWDLIADMYSRWTKER